MKINFWQWIGIVLLLAVLGWWAYEKYKVKGTPTTNPTTKPAGQY
jgi:hypothetical protein